MYQLRPYQREAVDAVIAHFRKESKPALIVLPTGSGKSLVIAELARLARGRVLVLAHVKELVEQNHAKFVALGETAAIFAAGLQRKEATAKVVFGSVQSVARNLDQFREPISLLIIDECHRVALDEESQYQQVINHLRQINPQLRLLGLTATPFRLGIGWIYRHHYHGMLRTHEPRLFERCIYELPLRVMIKGGYLTPPTLIDAPIVHYDFSRLQNQTGLFSEAELDKELKRQQRATPQIVAQIVEYGREKAGGMIFAATTKHAHEVCDLLEKQGERAALILGSTPLAERDQLITAFKAREYHYLVNVAVLTTGFDAPHVDLIALLRPTESVSLYQQIAGRGLRLAEGKKECLILDYAGNRHSLFSPEVGVPKPKGDCEPVQVICPACGYANLFWGKTDSAGKVIEHYGRRCMGLFSDEESGEEEECDYRFRSKLCPFCGAENDIAARNCHACHEALVDPDDKLKAALNLKDCLVLRCAGLTLNAGRDKKGNARLVVTYHDEEGVELTAYHSLNRGEDWPALQRNFVRPHWPAPGLEPEFHRIDELLAAAMQFRHPDFVIARKQKHYWRVVELIFDYAGRYRRANEL